MRTRQRVVARADSTAAVRAGFDAAALPRHGLARVAARVNSVKGKLPAARDTRWAGPLSLLKRTKA